MIKESLLRNWSAAIVSIAIEQNKVDEYIQTAHDLTEIFRDNFILTDFLANNSISLENRKKVLATSLEGKIDKNILSALFLIIERKLAGASRQIFKQVEHDLLVQKNIVTGYIYSIEPLNKNLIKKIEEKFKEKLGKNILLKNEIRKELIAGIKVEIEGHKYDSSAQGKVLDLKRKVLNNRN